MEKGTTNKMFSLTWNWLRFGSWVRTKIFLVDVHLISEIGNLYVLVQLFSFWKDISHSNYKLSFRKFKLQTLKFSFWRIKCYNPTQSHPKHKKVVHISLKDIDLFASVLTITRIFMRQIWVLKGKNYTFMVRI